MTLKEVNAMDRATFTAAFGWIFEHSPWVAEAAWQAAPFSSVEALLAAMVEAVKQASSGQQTELIRAHPDLGTRARISPASTGEQSGAGWINSRRKSLRDCSNSTRHTATSSDFRSSTPSKAARSSTFCGPSRSGWTAVRKRNMPWLCGRSTALHGIVWRNSFMHQFASGPKRNYYGKGDVIVYRLHRDGRTPPGKSPVFGANVTLLIYGDAFWPTYETGDNSGLIATDSMKNFIQRETLNFTGFDLEEYCQFLAVRFLETYPHVAGAQIRAEEIPYQGVADGSVAFAPAGPERAFAQLELSRANAALETVELRPASRLPSVAPGRQRISWLRPRPIYDATRYLQPAAAHVARPGLALHWRGVHERRGHRYRPRHGAGNLPWL